MDIKNCVLAILPSEFSLEFLMYQMYFSVKVQPFVF